MRESDEQERERETEREAGSYPGRLYAAVVWVESTVSWLAPHVRDEESWRCGGGL